MVRPRAVTSYDVAKHAGVSQATVSAVLNNKHGTIRVSEETRRRVLAAVETLQYSPNPLAQGLRRRRSGIIGFVPLGFYRKRHERPLPTMQLLNLQIARAAIQHGYHVLEATAESAASRGSEELVRFLLDQRVDGVIVDRPETAAEVRRLVERGLPVVQLLAPHFDCPTPAITVDMTPGTDAAIDHLVGQGHRRIAFLGHHGARPHDRARLDCFRAALARHRLALPEEYVRLGETTVVTESCALATALLALPERPTAILAATEGLALGALRALYAARVHVPEAMSLVSSNDALAVHLYPPLTSITLPFEEIAHHAVALLTAQLDGDVPASGEPTRIVLPTQFTIRESTRPPLGARDEVQAGR